MSIRNLFFASMMLGVLLFAACGQNGKESTKLKSETKGAVTTTELASAGNGLSPEEEELMKAVEQEKLDTNMSDADRKALAKERERLEKVKSAMDKEADLKNAIAKAEKSGASDAEIQKMRLKQLAAEKNRAALQQEKDRGTASKSAYTKKVEEKLKSGASKPTIKTDVATTTTTTKPAPASKPKLVNGEQPRTTSGRVEPGSAKPQRTERTDAEKLAASKPAATGDRVEVPTSGKPAKPAPPAQANPLDPFFEATDKFMKKYVRNGLVNYSGINKSELTALKTMIAEANVARSSSAEKQAFYINAYNILTISSLINNGLPSSPLDVSGFFDTQTHKVTGQKITLDKLEKGWLFSVKKDPRFHFVVVCGAKGCPKLANFGYTPSNVGSKLNSQTRKVLNDDYFIRLDKSAKKVEISELFNWYKADFTQSGSVIDYINQYRDEKIPSDFPVSNYKYDWKINKQ